MRATSCFDEKITLLDFFFTALSTEFVDKYPIFFAHLILSDLSGAA